MSHHYSIAVCLAGDTCPVLRDSGSVLSHLVKPHQSAQRYRLYRGPQALLTA